MRAASPVSLLIVSESGPARRQLREMLEQSGFRLIEEAEGPREGLGKLQARSVSLVFCNWEMEPIDGLAFLAEVRMVRSAAPIRVVLLTSDGSWGRQTTARMAGADGVLVRPVRLENLRAKIDLVLARSEPRSYLRRA